MPKSKDEKTTKPVTKSDRLFSVNQDVGIGHGLAGVVQGYYSPTLVSVRVSILNLDKASGEYLKNFRCLTPNGHASRLYAINQTELARHNNEQKRKAVKGTKKQIKSK